MNLDMLDARTPLFRLRILCLTKGVFHSTQHERLLAHVSKISFFMGKTNEIVSAGKEGDGAAIIQS